MITNFPKVQFEKIMLRSGYAERNYGWGEISLGCEKWPKINFAWTTFHKSLEDECNLTLVKCGKKVILGIVDAEAILQPISETQFIVLTHAFYRRLELTLINVSELLPMEKDLDDIVSQFMEPNPKYLHLKDLKPDFQCYFRGGIQGTCTAEKELHVGINSVNFEGDFHSIDEFLISHTSCIYQFLPSKGQINILPQDWLAQDLIKDWDVHSYGFSRDPKSGRIFGFLDLQDLRGMWNPVVTKYVRLDDTGMNMETWLNLIE